MNNFATFIKIVSAHSVRSIIKSKHRLTSLLVNLKQWPYSLPLHKNLSLHSFFYNVRKLYVFLVFESEELGLVFILINRYELHYIDEIRSLLNQTILFFLMEWLKGRAISMTTIRPVVKENTACVAVAHQNNVLLLWRAILNCLL